LFAPRIATPQRAGVLHCHGAVLSDPVPLDVTATYITTFQDEPLSLAKHGITSMAADMGGGDTFGNATADAAVSDAMTYIRANGANSNPVGLVGGSMGGCVSLNWARTHLADVACIALIIPAVNLEDIRANNRGGYATTIEAAHGGAAAWQTARPTRNPLEYASQLAGIPIAIWYSTDDPICVPAQMNAFAAAHGNTVLNSMGAVGHTGFVLDGMLLAAWMNQYLH